MLVKFYSCKVLTSSAGRSVRCIEGDSGALVRFGFYLYLGPSDCKPAYVFNLYKPQLLDFWPMEEKKKTFYFSKKSFEESIKFALETHLGDRSLFQSISRYIHQYQSQFVSHQEDVDPCWQRFAPHSREERRQMRSKEAKYSIVTATTNFNLYICMLSGCFYIFKKKRYLRCFVILANECNKLEPANLPQCWSDDGLYWELAFLNCCTFPTAVAHIKVFRWCPGRQLHCRRNMTEFPSRRTHTRLQNQEDLLRGRWYSGMKMVPSWNWRIPNQE